MLVLYQLLVAAVLTFAGPFLLLQKKSRAGLAQKFGAVPAAIASTFKSTRPIWFHAVSVGEFNAVWPLVQAYHKAHPETGIFISTTTATGQKLAQEKAGSIAQIGYFPFDLKPCVDAWLDALNPRLAVIVETEIWPLFITECANRKIPICVVNGRISPRSFERYKKFTPFFGPIMKRFVKAGVQSQAEAVRYKTLAGDSLETVVLGNLKFDGLAPVSKEKREDLARDLHINGGDLVFVVGSTHEGEETQIIAAYKNVLRTTGGEGKLRLILAPRHPERFDRVAELLTNNNFRVRRVSRSEAFEQDHDVLLVDSIGHLFALYSLATVAFVGGTLAPIGGHNLLEPCAYSVPVLAGPHVEKTRDVARALQARQALVTVKDGDELAQRLTSLLTNAAERQRIGQAGRDLLTESQGAVAQALLMLESILGQAPADAARKAAIKGAER